MDAISSSKATTNTTSSSSIISKSVQDNNRSSIGALQKYKLKTYYHRTVVTSYTWLLDCVSNSSLLPPPPAPFYVK